MIRELIDKNRPYFLISKETKLHPYVVKKSHAQAQRFSLSELKKIYQKIFEVDLNIKTGKIDPQIALDLLIAELQFSRFLNPKFEILNSKQYLNFNALNPKLFRICDFGFGICLEFSAQDLEFINFVILDFFLAAVFFLINPVLAALSNNL